MHTEFQENEIGTLVRVAHSNKNDDGTPLVYRPRRSTNPTEFISVEAGVCTTATGGCPRSRVFDKAVLIFNFQFADQAAGSLGQSGMALGHLRTIGKDTAMSKTPRPWHPLFCAVCDIEADYDDRSPKARAPAEV